MKGAQIIGYWLVENDADDECKGCNSLAHMIGFTHDAIMDLCPSVALLPRTFDLCQYTKHELAYLHVLDEPNYPVPAIRYHVDAGRTGVAIWNNSKYESIMHTDAIYDMIPDYEYY
jgi:hypothetical protein